jgi:CPA1 family monovalent cation:H+ antiporter
LTWGGLRGGISVAMALALHRHLHSASESARDLILTSTYLVVVFSVLVQGLTVSNLVGRLFGREVEADVRTEAAGAYEADSSDA